MAELPPYKPSGQGGSVDMKNILVSHMIAWGTFKHQFKSKYKELAGTRWINGHEVFNDIRLEGRLNQGSQTYEFMKFIGFTEEDIVKLNNDISNPEYKIKEASLHYQLNEDYEQEDFEMALSATLEYRNKFDYLDIEITNDSKGRSLRDFGIKNGFPIPERNSLLPPKAIPVTDFVCVESDEWGCNRYEAYPVKEYITSMMSFYAYKDGRNVTSTIPRTVLEYFAFLAMAESEMISQKYISQRSGIVEASSPSNLKVDVKITKYRYDFNKVDIYKLKEDRFNYYTWIYGHHFECKDCTQEGYDRRVIPRTMNNLLWVAERFAIDNNLLEYTGGLFIQKKQLFPTDDWEPVEFYLTVDGIDTCTEDQFAYFMSQFMDIRTKRDKGGWFKRFIGGLIKAILSIIGAILELMLRIPILKQVTIIILKIIAKIAGVSFDTAKEMLKQIILAIIMIVISFLMPQITTLLGTSTTSISSGLSIGLVGGASTALTYANYGMQLFSALQNGKMVGEMKEIAEERAEKEYARRKLEDAQWKSKEAFIGTMGTYSDHQQKDYMMFTGMFNLFDTMEQAILPQQINESINQF